MEQEPLDAEDHASVRLAAQQLSTHHDTGSLDEHLQRWAGFVAEVEEGIDAMWACQFDHDARARDWLHDAWPILTERVRRIHQPQLDALDERFRAATAPITPLGMTPAEMAERPEWWLYRYPLRVTGDPADPLPPAWSPEPDRIE
ncbi:hypothetical protein [Streptomyces erythrochromogenes]|uniref:hypothetical protein n=1 Tax=Streptomyces erythrochromogenes TaxID=285574 RepID=UPI003803E993|nr:hypothetical protein OG489_12990 [Streptomyces erythrochromogenes]